MLTKDDLQQLRKIIREETENESQKLQNNISSTNLKLRMELSTIGDRMKNIEIGNTQMQKDVHSLKDGQTKLKEDVTNIHKNTKAIKKELKTVTNFLDKDISEAARKVKRIEQHLNLPPLHY